MAVLGGGNGPDPDVLRLRLASDGMLRFSGYSSRRFDEAVSDGGRRTDMPGRAAAYKRAQQVLAEDLPIMPLAEGVRVTVCGRGVRGLPQTDARGLVGDFDYSLVRVER
jgi:peptide/nickel transport system substrate-binding protein